MTRALADTPTLGSELLWQLLARQPDVDGLITTSDRVGFGVLAGLAMLKRTGGKDVGIIGFGDDPASAYLAPALTTIRPDRKGVAEKAADLIVARIGGEPGEPAVAGWQLVARGT
jgi:LacI family gluconate utilization system Gnt-I transcriptional repressor